MVKGGHQAGPWLGGQDFGSQPDDCKTPMLHGLAVSGSCTQLADRPSEAGSSGNPLTSQAETNGSAGDSGRRSAERKYGTGASATRSVRIVTHKCFRSVLIDSASTNSSTSISSGQVIHVEALGSGPLA